MKFERFKTIIEYSAQNRISMEKAVFNFYRDIGMESKHTICNFMQIVRPLFETNNFLVIELPYKDLEIGALCYKGDSMGYIFLNSSLPKVNMNFALCHEVYHVFYQESGLENKVELYMNEQYYEHEEEFAANLFAGMVLMPEQNFKYMFHKFAGEGETDEAIEIILAKLMNYFEVPYMAVLIRCYELNLLESGELLKHLLNIDKEMIKNTFEKLWLEESLLKATKKDDFEKFLEVVSSRGLKYLENGYINQNMYDKALKNMKTIYQKIRG